jgi:hypothetical protein
MRSLPRFVGARVSPTPEPNACGRWFLQVDRSVSESAAHVVDDVTCAIVGHPKLVAAIMDDRDEP